MNIVEDLASFYKNNEDEIVKSVNPKLEKTTFIKIDPKSFKIKDFVYFDNKGECKNINDEYRFKLKSILLNSKLLFDNANNAVESGKQILSNNPFVFTFNNKISSNKKYVYDRIITENRINSYFYACYKKFSLSDDWEKFKIKRKRRKKLILFKNFLNKNKKDSKKTSLDEYKKKLKLILFKNSTIKNSTIKNSTIEWEKFDLCECFREKVQKILTTSKLKDDNLEINHDNIKININLNETVIFYLDIDIESF